MQPRFIIIQGGLVEGDVERIPVEAIQGDGWRVVVRMARTVEEQEIADWRALAGRNPQHSPFADPDFLLTAARHDPSETIVFALAYAEDRTGRDHLAAVLPLELPHPVFGDSLVRLWHPALAPTTVEPICEVGAAAPALEAVIAHFASKRPRRGLLLGRLREDGALLRELQADARLTLELKPQPDPIPAASFVEVFPRLPAPEIELITDPATIRDAVERFLLLDARRSRKPLLDDTSRVAAIRVATRLLAKRGLARVELGRVQGEIVSAAIRLGEPDHPMLWRSVDTYEPPAEVSPTVDVRIGFATEMRTAASADRIRLVAP